MRKRVGVVLLVISLVVASRAAAQSIVQESQGSCSPAVAGFGGIPQITCPGVDPQALARLNELLIIQKGPELLQKIEEATEWAEKYRDLSAGLAATADDRQVAQQARDLIVRGEFEKAGLLLDQLLAKPESQLDRLATNHFNRAQLFDLQFQTDRALPHYEKAYRSRPNTSQYAFAYGMALYSQHEYSKALDVAQSLRSLAVLHSTTQRLPAAERAYKEALALYRALATQNPDPLRSVLAGILNNLGILYSTSLHPAKAEIPYQEALAIRRALAAQNPDAFRPDVAQTLNNLGILYSATKRPTKAVGAYQEALTIRRALAVQNPDAFRPKVAATLWNLTLLYKAMGSRGNARLSAQEALMLYRDLAGGNPDLYRYEVRELSEFLEQLSRSQ